MIRIVIADDHQVVRSGLEQLLATAADMELVGTAADGAEAVVQAEEHTPTSCSWTSRCLGPTASRPRARSQPATAEPT